MFVGGCMEIENYLVWRDEFLDEVMCLKSGEVTMEFLDSLVLEALEWAKVEAFNEIEARVNFLYFYRLNMNKIKFDEQYEIKNKTLSIQPRVL